MVMLYNIIDSNVDVDLAMFHILIDSDLVHRRGHPLRMLNPIVSSMLVCTLLFPATSTYGTLSLNAL